MRFSSRLAVAALAAGCFGLAAAPASAQANPNAFRFFGTYEWPTSNLDLKVDSEDPNAVQVTETNEFDSTWGVGASWERRFNGPLGIELGAKYYRPELNLPGNGVFGIPGVPFKDKVSIVPITAGVNFHLGSSDKFDFYLGPQVAYVTYGSVNPPNDVTLDEFDFDDELTWGAKVGLDIPLNETWAFTVSADYLAAKAALKVNGAEYRIDPKPFSLNVGATVRF